MSRGGLVVLEGADKVGKSTQLAHAAAYLGRRGYRVVCGRDPGGTPVAEALRGVVVHEAMAPWAEVLTFCAARAELVDAIVVPALAAGRVVLLDRYQPSTLVYQGEQVGEAAIWALEALVGAPPADVVIVLDRDEPLGLDAGDRFEGAGLERWRAVRDRYRLLAPREGWWLVDASGDEDALASAIGAMIDERLEALGVERA